MLENINENLDIDHIGHVLHDNRKLCLRICDESHNMRNSNMHTNNTSGVSGVWWFSDRNKWVAEMPPIYIIIQRIIRKAQPS